MPGKHPGQTRDGPQPRGREGSNAGQKATRTSTPGQRRQDQASRFQRVGRTARVRPACNACAAARASTPLSEPGPG
eukprot:11156902-Lingulodinium_polyedra.AAC.1